MTSRRLGDPLERLANAIDRLANAIGRLTVDFVRPADTITRLGQRIESLAGIHVATMRPSVWHERSVAKETQVERSEKSESGTHEETWIRCSACGHALTPARARIEVEGKHVHTFVNPAGFEYTIRCFGEAPGCAGAGEESTFWTWFRGFAWRMAMCGGCGAHVGWSFRKEESVFWGLVVDRIAG